MKLMQMYARMASQRRLTYFFENGLRGDDDETQGEMDFGRLTFEPPGAQALKQHGQRERSFDVEDDEP